MLNHLSLLQGDLSTADGASEVVHSAAQSTVVVKKKRKFSMLEAKDSFLPEHNWLFFSFCFYSVSQVVVFSDCFVVVGCTVLLPFVSRTLQNPPNWLHVTLKGWHTCHMLLMQMQSAEFECLFQRQDKWFWLLLVGMGDYVKKKRCMICRNKDTL